MGARATRSLSETTLREKRSQAVGCGGDGRSGKVGGRGEGESGEVGRPDGESAAVSLEGVPLLPRKLLQIRDVGEGPVQDEARLRILVAAAVIRVNTGGYFGTNRSPEGVVISHYLIAKILNKDMGTTVGSQ